MRIYETTFIVNPQLEDASIDRQVNAVADVITSSDGKILHADHMGTRRLAYQIRSLTQGYYASFIFEAPSNVVSSLDHHFRMNEEYLRHLTVRYEGLVLEEKAQRQKEEAKTDDSSETSEISKDVSEEVPAQPESAPEPETAIEPEPPAEETTVTEPPTTPLETETTEEKKPVVDSDETEKDDSYEEL